MSLKDFGGRRMKTVVYVLIGLLLIAGVSAATIDYKARCDIIRPATEYRPEKNYGPIGIWGALSNGEKVCFMPGEKKELKAKPVCKNKVVDVCEDVEVCETVGEWELTWKKVCGHHGCHWIPKWEYKTHEECNMETQCHEETKKVCK